MDSAGQWQGGSVSEVVAVDAKNSTPLSAVAYAFNGTSTWHVFYIDTNNTIKQRTSSNTTNGVWADGPVNAANIKTNNADTVGMQACWYGGVYGDSDYPNIPANSSITNLSPQQVGMHLWYGE